MCRECNSRIGRRINCHIRTDSDHTWNSEGGSWEVVESNEFDVTRILVHRSDSIDLELSRDFALILEV